MINTYVRNRGRAGCYLVPYKKYNWTGNLKFETIDGETTIYIESVEMLFGFIPLWNTWISEKNIVFREEEVIIYEC